jgi:hypothetical protein
LVRGFVVFVELPAMADAYIPAYVPPMSRFRPGGCPESDDVFGPCTEAPTPHTLHRAAWDNDAFQARWVTVAPVHLTPV